MMRERFDRIEIIDLRGNIRRGERAGVNGDVGVFNIQVGTAITIAVADGSKVDGALAKVSYIDSWDNEAFSQKAKLDWLQSGTDAGRMLGATLVERELLADMRPAPFQDGSWADLQTVFPFSKSGMKSGKDSIFVKFEPQDLETAVAPLLAMRDDSTFDKSAVRKYAYRPLDFRYYYNDRKLLDRPGPEMQDTWGADNVGFYTMPSGIGEGPAVWCHELHPDYHAFRGSYGGYAFPLYDRRPGNNPVNLSPALLAGLAMTYGQAVTPEDVFDAMLALLSARSYTLRFAEDLEDVFPHIPFPSAHSVFERAAAIGAEIRAVETFARKPGDAFLTKSLAKEESDPTGVLADSIDWRDGEIILCADGSGRVSGIPEHIWQFAVSGYRLLPRWLGARAGQTVDRAFMKSMRDVAGRIAELIDLFDRADIVLADALKKTATRAELGLEPTEDEND